MADVIPFALWRRYQPRTCAFPQENAEILFFTGVRYERPTEPGPQQAAADGYLLVKPGEPEKSFLLLKVSPNLDEKYGSAMPDIPGFSLSEQEVKAISDWIKNGAKND